MDERRGLETYRTCHTNLKVVHAPEQVLKETFGYDSFRPDQEPIVDAVLTGRDVLAVMPTGAGKSICYQVPALCTDGLTLVISPLISLMKDQVESLRLNGVAAACLNSSLPAAERTRVLDEAKAGSVTLLYVAPERLSSPEISTLCDLRPPSIVAIDEAHCASQWGHDFRPDYLGISSFVRGLAARPVLCAFTATATKAVRDDIQRILGLVDPLVVVANFDRPNLHFSVERVHAGKEKDRALHRVMEAHEGQCGIVYCMTRKNVEAVCDELCTWGFSATRYHGGLSDAERHANQEDFVYDRAQVMVATNAFGMGIDKSNVNFIIHYNLSLDLESYYQEAGRAGRDGTPADCILLYSPGDVHTAEFLVERGIDDSEGIDFQTRAALLERAEERLRQMTFYATTSDCLRGFILRYFDQEAPGYCGNCGNCETEFEERDVTIDAQKIISCVYRLRERGRTVGESTIADILHGSKASRIMDNGYDQLRTYGIMADSSINHIRFVLNELIVRGLLSTATVGRGNLRVVVFTDESRRWLHDKGTLVLRVPKEKKPKPKVERTAKGAGTTESGGVYDEKLFEKLRTLRARLASEQSIPAYMVFSSKTLQDMCRRLPGTKAEFLEVNGVGEKKAERYGEAFLAAINGSGESSEEEPSE